MTKFSNKTCHQRSIGKVLPELVKVWAQQYILLPVQMKTEILWSGLAEISVCPVQCPAHNLEFLKVITDTVKCFINFHLQSVFDCREVKKTMTILWNYYGHKLWSYALVYFLSLTMLTSE